ncbi:SET domain-containing protein [Madurella fahalii]|uniref:SET domain-containing protein n=1 Tax=Madurella fahalii TaxID=1157608 RepID=A0ABQ0FYA5_9PEZI
MNAHDLSDIPAFVQSLQEWKRIILAAQSRAGERPPPRKPRAETVFEFNLRRMGRRAKISTDPGAAQMWTSFAPSPYPPCVQPFCDLTKIMIDNLRLETHHRGTYLMLRSITPQDRMTSVMSIVEDENGEHLLLQLYHQEEEKGGAAEDILVKGMAMIVKEPYLKGDIRWRGNDNFGKSKFQSAVESYTQALGCSPTAEEAHTIKLNRSLAFLKTKQFDAALSDIESATAAPKPAEKALFRKSQALYDLQRYRECCEVLKVLRMEYPNNNAAKVQLDRAIKRLAEHTNGRYQFAQLHAEAARLRPPHLDHATYIGPVHVKASGSRGRGLFTSRAVKAGDLLFCEKAFAHAFVDEEGASGGIRDTTILIDAEADSVTMGAHPDLINMVIQKLYRNPSLAPVITDLHHGSYEPVDTSHVDSTPVVDTFLVRRIIALNAFGCPVSSQQPHSRALKQDSQTRQLVNEQFHSCGIWPTASYINHSCYSNTWRSFIGDMMIVRATQDLASDTEITFWYQLPTTDGYLEHQGKFRTWKFKCDCAMCQDAQQTSEGIFAKRKSLRADLVGCIQIFKQTSAAKVGAIIAAIAATYKRPAHEVPRLAVWDIQLALAGAFWQHLQPIETIELALGALASLGYDIDGGSLPRKRNTTIVVRRWGLMVNGVINCWILLRDAYRLAAPDLVGPAEGYARISYRICVGEAETFDETYGNPGWIG